MSLRGLNPYRSRFYLSVAVTVTLALALTLLSIEFFGEYGLALFFLTPLFIGFCSGITLGYKLRLSFKTLWLHGFINLLIFGAALLFFAIEGLICLAMVAPLAFACSLVGSILAHLLLSRSPDTGAVSVLILFLAIPLVSAIEENNSPEIFAVTTAIEINASQAEVWKNVIEFPQLAEPGEFLFRAGIAYPVNARIEGTGVGAVRHCNFTTGSFIEPITIWKENELLAFDVKDQPLPMTEISPWKIEPPHLKDYFVSVKGQFRLVKVGANKTRLEGTTWYYNKIRPAFYWKTWSNYIVHKIHYRVLEHIKKNAEEQRG